MKFFKGGPPDPRPLSITNLFYNCVKKLSFQMRSAQLKRGEILKESSLVNDE